MNDIARKGRIAQSNVGTNNVLRKIFTKTNSATRCVVPQPLQELAVKIIMQILGIYTCRVYEKDGEKKRQFYKAGIVKTAPDGRMFIRLFHQPFTEFYIMENNPAFPQKQSGDAPTE